MTTNPVHADLDDLMADVSLAAIVFDRRGNQIRQVITGSKTHTTFSYPSKRFHRAQCGDGETELLIHKVHEVAAATIDFLPQPCRIEATVRGRPVRAIPDYAYVAVGEAPVLGEAKTSWAEFERPKARLQQALTRKAADALGWTYEQKTRASLGSAEFLANVDEVQAHRFDHVPLRQEQAAANALAAHRSLPLGEVAAAIGEGLGRGRGLVCAMMVRRILEIDLHRPLDERSVVRPAPELPFAFPRIRL